jgi:phage-related protein
LPEYGLFKAIGNVFKAVGNAVKDVVKSVGTAVKQVVSSPVGRMIATVAISASALHRQWLPHSLAYRQH